MFRIATVLTAATLPVAELSAARLDGELFAVDESWVCVDEPDRQDLRARALRDLLPDSPSAARLVMMGLTATWLHGATDAPPWRHEVCSRSDDRVMLWLPHRFVLRELAVTDREVCRIGPLLVTSPARTAFDLARCGEEMAVLSALVARFGIRPADVADSVSSGLPGAKHALGRIAAAGTQPPLTRYTS